MNFVGNRYVGVDRVTAVIAKQIRMEKRVSKDTYASRLSFIKLTVKLNASLDIRLIMDLFLAIEYPVLSVAMEDPTTCRCRTLHLG